MLYCARALVEDQVEILVGRSPLTGEWYSAATLWDLKTTSEYLANRHELAARFGQLSSAHRLPPPLTVEPRSYLAPVDADRQIFAVGLNYHDHVKELGVEVPQEPYFFIKPANFTKWRELSLAFDAPDRIASRIGAHALSVTASGRNLSMITRYTGIDPENSLVSSGGSSSAIGIDQAEYPQLTTFVVTVRVAW